MPVSEASFAVFPRAVSSQTERRQEANERCSRRDQGTKMRHLVGHCDRRTAPDALQSAREASSSDSDMTTMRRVVPEVNEELITHARGRLSCQRLQRGRIVLP